MLCLLAARAAGRPILDGVYNDVRDATGFEAECLAGRQLGFDGKLSNFFGGTKAEVAPFKGEPTRDALTQPPPGYQTPSPNFAYGTGPKESLNKEYNPAAGKYGE